MPAPSRFISELTNQLAQILEGRSTPSSSLLDTYKISLQVALDEMITEAPRSPRLETRTNFDVSAGISLYTLADDVNLVIATSFYSNEGGDEDRPMRYVSESDVDQAYFSQFRNRSGQPLQFTLTALDTAGNLRVEFFPTPDQTYTVYYRYYAMPSRIDTVDNANLGTTTVDPRIPVNIHWPLISGALINVFPDRLKQEELRFHTRAWERAKRDWRQSMQTESGVAYKVQSSRRRRRGVIGDAERYDGYTGPDRGFGFYS